MASQPRHRADFRGRRLPQRTATRVVAGSLCVKLGKQWRILGEPCIQLPERNRRGRVSRHRIDWHGIGPRQANATEDCGPDAERRCRRRAFRPQSRCADKKNAALTLVENTIQATDALTGRRHCRSGEVPGWTGQGHRRRGAVSEFVGVVGDEKRLISDQLSVAHFESPG